jgi:hypothetical protein
MAVLTLPADLAAAIEALQGSDEPEGDGKVRRPIGGASCQEGAPRKSKSRMPDQQRKRKMPYLQR